MKTPSNSRPQCRGLYTLLLCIAALWAMPTGARAQTPTQITISDLSLRRDEVGSNPINIPTGDHIELSASVTPNGAQGTTATAQTTNLSNGSLFGPIMFPYDPITADLNLFDLKIGYDPNHTGQWTVTFSNATATPPTLTMTTKHSIEDVAAAPAGNVTASGSSLDPTFCWSYPSSVDGLQINVYDTAAMIDGRVNDNVFSVDVPVAQGCYTLPTTFDGGYTLNPGTTYVIDFKARVLFDPSGPNENSNTAADYQAYYSFTPTSTGTLPHAIYLPTIDSNGVYNFNLTVQPNTTYYIDPAVATGFVYATGAGNPNFATVVLPALQGSEPYTITWDNGLHKEQVLGGSIFNFPDPLGVSSFAVRGIDPADGVDPTSGTEFVTGLTFVAAGNFTGTMTPLSTVYITNEGSKTVSVVDPSTNTVVDTVSVGFGPVQAVLPPKGTTAYVLNSGAGTVSVVNTSTNSVTTTLKVGFLPTHAAVSPGGSTVCVTNTGSNSVSVISTATQSVIATIPVGLAPVGVAITPDGTHAYVTNAGSENVSVIDTATNTVSAVVGVGAFPLAIALTPDGSSAYVANSLGNTVSVINTGTNTVKATVRVGFDPVDVAITPNGATAYVADALADSVTVLSTATNQVVTTLPVGFLPIKTAITPNGAAAYVADAGAKSVSVINTATNTVIATIGVGADPVGLVVSPDGVHAYVTNAGSKSVSVIDTGSNTVTATVPVGVRPVNGAIF